MIPDVSRTRLLQAIEEYDTGIRDAPEWVNWESKDTYKYAIVHEGKRYPVKQIIRMATGATDFSGGEEANNYVTKRGLSVIPLENARAEQDGLGLRDRLEEILAEYASARASEPIGGHELRSTFKGVSDVIVGTRALSERPSLRVTWSIGQGKWVTIPWVALLDARETDTTQRGAYGVYLFREDMSGVYLAFAQGVTEPKAWYGNTAQAREYLRTQAVNLRRYCEDLTQQGFALDNDIDLHTDVGLGTDYEASTIAHKFYAAESVPDDQTLISDLETVLSAYDRYLEDPKSRLWCVYAGRSTATNFELAREKGVWGADNGTKFEGIERGDLVWFVHDLVSDESPAPSGFPRVKLRAFGGIAKLAVLGRVTSDVFKDTSPVWPDGTYPYRFDFEELHKDHEVTLNNETFSPSVGNAVRRSAITQGRPVLAREWDVSVLNGGNPFSKDAESPFSVETFDLLAGLHKDPTKTYYQAHRGAIRDHVEDPFRRLVREVARRLPAPIIGLMETEKGVFAKILKNDYGRGGAWPFYWGAFYPKGGKRIKDVQLSTGINKDQLEFGFYMGHYGSDQRERFLDNCRQYREQLVTLLEPSMGSEAFVYGDDKVIAPHSKTRSLSQWLENIGEMGIDASIVIPRDRVLELSAQDLIEIATHAFELLFPLVLLATSEDPMPEIIEYIGEENGGPEPKAKYSIEQLSWDTGIGEEKLRRWVRAIDRKGQAIFYGPPGTGKTFIAQHLAKHLTGGGDGFYDLVQFHPSYSYEDFVQGIRPESRDGTLSYPVVPGRFKEFCREAAKRNSPCVLIVDEINRANLSRVFGELMYLLEYREEEVPLAGGGKFRIPENVRLIGTMNTADRSIALVDHALRRRFAFLELYPDYELLRKYHSTTGFPVDNLIGELRKLNRRIDDRHYEVGITFVEKERLGEELEDIWRMEIEPYLEEYFFDRQAVVDEYRWERIGGTLSP